jgi:hypothetical protein
MCWLKIIICVINYIKCLACRCYSVKSYVIKVLCISTLLTAVRTTIVRLIGATMLRDEGIVHSAWNKFRMKLHHLLNV